MALGEDTGRKPNDSFTGRRRTIWSTKRKSFNFSWTTTCPILSRSTPSCTESCAVGSLTLKTLTCHSQRSFGCGCPCQRSLLEATSTAHKQRETDDDQTSWFCFVAPSQRKWSGTDVKLGGQQPSWSTEPQRSSRTESTDDAAPAPGTTGRGHQYHR